MRLVVVTHGSALAGFIGVVLLGALALQHWWFAAIIAVFVGLVIVGWASERT